jgi:predicted dehydrogenase
MDRRRFLKTALAAPASLAIPEGYAALLDEKPKRVGIIGPGWYGKIDLIRLLQVAPVEVVSMCDVDKHMLDQAADLIQARQSSKKRPRTYADYRKMLAERDLDIVLIATPDHWHALPMIEAVKAGCDVYQQKPISADVIEGAAMLAAARKYGRVVQVGLQRRSTPHLVEARDQIIREGKLGKIGLVEIYCYYPMRLNGMPPNIPPPEYLDWDAWTGPAPLRPYNAFIHPGQWRAYKEYCNGIIGDMCVHMLDMTRWMLGLGWPNRISSEGGIFVQKNSVANIPDTQTATFEFDDLTVVWQHRTWGNAPDPQDQWGAAFYGDKGTLKASVYRYEFTPLWETKPTIHKDVTYELEQYPEDKTEERLEKHCAPAIRYHMLDFLAAIAKRSKPVADIEEGFISTSSCILANVALETGRAITWDPVKLSVVDNEEANRRLRRVYRQGYAHPEPNQV